MLSQNRANLIFISLLINGIIIAPAHPAMRGTGEGLEGSKGPFAKERDNLALVAYKNYQPTSVIVCKIRKLCI